jgi:hypothetical protein
MQQSQYNWLKNQEGSLMLTTLFVFMVVMLMGTTILRTAIIESRLAGFSIRNEMVRQAADAGIAIARDVIINYRQAGQPIADLEEIRLNNGCQLSIEFDASQLVNGIVTVTSRAYLKDNQGQLQASKTAVADILVNTVPCYPVRANKLKIMGPYYATLSVCTINDEWEQNWDVKAAEPRLNSDPPLPELYPLHGSTYNSMEPWFLKNHPYFTVNNQVWPDHPEPEYSWWIDYEYGTNSANANNGSSENEGLDYHDRQTSSAKLAPFYVPYGYLQIIDQTENPAELALVNGFNDILTSGEATRVFIDDLTLPVWGEYLSEEWYQSQLMQEFNRVYCFYPEKMLYSRDFIKSAQFPSVTDAPGLKTGIFSISQQQARSNSQWEYIAAGSQLLTKDNDKYLVSMEQLDKAFIYFDLLPEDTLILDFGARFSNDNTGPPTGILESGQDNLVIIAESNLEIIIDSCEFEQIQQNLQLYLISAGNIKLTMVDYSNSPQIQRILPAFLLANEDIIINSQVRYWLLPGLINAGGEIFIEFDLDKDLARPEPEPYLVIQENLELISDFPLSWDLIGLGAIVDYDYSF